jgi:maltooligosyltrehalose trehalohydrolase
MTTAEPGAFLQPPSSCQFLLWAPRGKRVTLRLVGPVYRDVGMSPLPHGYFETTVEGVTAGQRYFYRLDNGPDRPDPASRWQPDGVHGPSAVVDPAFAWRDEGWQGVPLAELVLYEAHVGTLTPDGTFDGAIGQLDRLRHLGVNALSIMPVAQFPGWRNWGYDGVYPFCVQNSYGGVAGFKRLIDAAHQRQMSVILDVVYNHLGPEGNYFREFGPYFTDQYRTPWGEPLNFDGPGSDAVRDFFLSNARVWQEEFHLDGLRLDAVPWIKDFSASHVLADLADQARDFSERLGRRFHVIGESDINDPRVIRPRSRGGLGLDAQWSDDFHHALHAYFTGERGGYYADHGTLEDLAKAYRNAYVLTGEYSRFRQRRYGALADDRPGEQFVIFAQNHDQVGNRPRGDRLSTMVDFDTLKLVAGLLLTSPYLPMLFMGEEYGETAPFPFFVNHSDGGLIDRVRRGRKHEFAAFGMHADPFDPASEETFRRAKLNVEQSDHGRGRELCDWHRELLRLRRELPSLAALDRQRMEVAFHEAERLLVVRRWNGRDKVLTVMNFGTTAMTTNLAIPEGVWSKLLDSSAAGDAPSELRGPGQMWLTLEARSFVLYHAG